MLQLKSASQQGNTSPAFSESKVAVVAFLKLGESQVSELTSCRLVQCFNIALSQPLTDSESRVLTWYAHVYQAYPLPTVALADTFTCF